MSFNYTPRSEEEVESAGLLPVGWYGFEVVKCEQKKSKTSGNDMLVPELRVFAPSDEKILTDYIVPGTSFGDRALRHFCAATNTIAEYQNKSIEASLFNGRTGFLRVFHQKDKQDGRLREKVGDYAANKPDAGTALPSKKAPTDEQLSNVDPSKADEDVPF